MFNVSPGMVDVQTEKIELNVWFIRLKLRWDPLANMHRSISKLNQMHV